MNILSLRKDSIEAHTAPPRYSFSGIPLKPYEVGCGSCGFPVHVSHVFHDEKHMSVCPVCMSHRY